MAIRTAPLISLLLALALIAPPAARPADACSCEAFSGRNGFAELQLDASEAIVVADVIAITSDRVNATRAAVAEVRTQYKGSGVPRVHFRSTGDEAACGYGALDQPGPHLLGLYGDSDGVLRASYCASFPMSAAADPASPYAAYLETLGGLAPPRTFEQSSDPPAWAIALYIGVSLVAVAALAAWSRRDRRSQRP